MSCHSDGAHQSLSWGRGAAGRRILKDVLLITVFSLSQEVREVSPGVRESSQSLACLYKCPSILVTLLPTKMLFQTEASLRLSIWASQE